ncbi:hypothetical protein GKD24_00320 [Lactobacillus paracasei]|uniref:hypothetical protein n=1 Tax=Lacticaseibacillus paracasei TaxID=1597 RepID=UPI000D3D1AF6|nr:hypothetical protein [Lacticaseibacillus paracasei]PTS56353.1 hypothetical protein DBQ61_09525 [Lactobacillus sp. DS22_6]MBX4165193.1 hypothetical protein [Lacticaseibacillus paracasei]MCZ2751455.1 hypothetical protein [Lacticaseibacillus paracasei]MCZ2761924.1 hypothetical protein [Lacticaseibacillus paracasei]MCZ2770345.1 hypothetical protein [Lacticaseibacillus paracasei]
MSNEDFKKREDIMRRLLGLAAEANHIKEYELGAAILDAYNVHKELDKRIIGVELPKVPRAALIEFKEDGPYLNGARIDGITDMKIDSKVDDFTRVDVKLVAKVHGLDDIKQEYGF